jgi:hypothetical protein
VFVIDGSLHQFSLFDGVFFASPELNGAFGGLQRCFALSLWVERKKSRGFYTRFLAFSQRQNSATHIVVVLGNVAV